MKAKTGTYLSPAQVQSFLTTYGDTITDGKAAVTKARINLGNAVNNLPVGTIYTITAVSGTHGAISPTGEIIVAEDGQQSFSILADSGYQITDVTVDGDSIGAVSSHTFNAISTDHTISAVFEATPQDSFSWWLPFIVIITGGHSN
jgi:hypothetical protein